GDVHDRLLVLEQADQFQPPDGPALGRPPGTHLRSRGRVGQLRQVAELARLEAGGHGLLGDAPEGRRAEAVPIPGRVEHVEPSHCSPASSRFEASSTSTGSSRRPRLVSYSSRSATDTAGCRWWYVTAGSHVS